MKNRICVTALLSLSLLASVPASAAIIQFAVVPLPPIQEQGIPDGLLGEVTLGVAVEARTGYWVLPATLTVGAGLTLECESSNFDITAEQARSTSDFLAELYLLVFATGSSRTRYSIPGWNSIEEDSCVECRFHYTGRAVEEPTNIAISGAGAAFTFVVNSTAQASNTALFHVCKEPPCDEQTP